MNDNTYLLYIVIYTVFNIGTGAEFFGVIPYSILESTLLSIS